jgi:hypothetical protein
VKIASLKLLCSGLLFFASGTAFAVCAVPRLIVPTERRTADIRPAIRWSAVDGASGYALKVQSRVPEGQIVASLDVVVAETHFVPPTALTDERAKVTVSVAARCKDGASAASSDWFLIDATAACPSPSRVSITLDNGRGVVAWPQSAGAALYEVRLHAPLDGRALKVLETREPHALLEGELTVGAVVSVRPRCAQAFGEPAFGFVTN